jgi:hypothetical protein
MLEYGIAYDSTLPGLIMAVRGMVAEGWQPQGGVTCVPADYEGAFAGHFIQAMVKPDASTGQFAYHLPMEVKAGV